jgi:two-component system heavy metal sensor histidine kinase CusS
MPLKPDSTLRKRLGWALGVTLAAVVALAGGAFMALQARLLERQLDASLFAHAQSEIQTAIDRSDHRAHLHNDAMHLVDSREPGLYLPKYAALYDGHGRAVAHTGSFQGRPPPFRALPTRGAFDLAHEGVTLRAVVLPMGHETEARTILLAVPRRTLDEANRSQLAVTLVVLGVALGAAVALAAFIARWLTRDLDQIARTARAVSDGALDARVGAVGGVAEVRSLARDMDAMIARLEALVATQRRFVSDAAHELRAPLTSLRGELELALRRPRSVEEYRAALEKALEDVLALGALADDLLALARARTATRERAPSDAAGPILRAVELIAPCARRRRVNIVPEALDVPKVSVAPRDLERVVRNLIENAMRHSPEGASVRVAASVDGNTVRVAVTDEGVGVPLAQAERIFEPFVRLDPARARDGSGSGLGLAIAREVARSNGGDVLLDVHYAGAGARFVAWFPVAS